MAKTDCPKCQAVQTLIKKLRDNPPPMSYEVEGPFKDVLEGVQAILDHKSLLDLAAERAIKTGDIKDLRMYRKIRRNQE